MTVIICHNITLLFCYL